MHFQPILLTLVVAIALSSTSATPVHAIGAAQQAPAVVDTHVSANAIPIASDEEDKATADVTMFSHSESEALREIHYEARMEALDHALHFISLEIGFSDQESEEFRVLYARLLSHTHERFNADLVDASLAGFEQLCAHIEEEYILDVSEHPPAAAAAA